MNNLLVESPYLYVFDTTFVCVCFFLITLELNRTPQDTTAASRQTDPEYLSDSDNDTESLATDDFLCSKSVILCAHAVNFCLPLYTSFLSGYVTADHSVNGDSYSDGENKDFAMLEDQTCKLHNLCG